MISRRPLKMRALCHCLGLPDHKLSSVFALERQPASNNTSDVDVSSSTDSTCSGSFYIDMTLTINSNNNNNNNQALMSTEPWVDYSNTPLYQALKPLMVSMKLWGIHFVRWTNTRRVINPPQIYSWLVTLTIWLYMAYNIYVMWKTTDQNGWMLVSDTAGLAWISYTSLNALCFVWASQSPRALQRFFEGFAKLDRFGGALTNIAKVGKIMMALVVFFWLTLVGNLSLNFYTIFSSQLANSSDSTTSAAVIIQTLSVKPQTVGVYAYSLFALFGQTIWIFMALLQVTISALIYSEFSLYGTFLRKKYRVLLSRRRVADHGNTNGIPLTSFAKDRERFLQMTRIVEAADNVFCLRNAASFACDIVLLCVLIYTMLYYPQHDGRSWLNAFVLWVSLAVADLMVICFCGTLVLHGIEKIKETLLAIDCEDIHERNFSVQVMLFLGKLNDRIGLSAGKFFIIDQTAVLSLVGMFVTYFLIIVQFAPLASSDRPANNDTSTSSSHTAILT